MRTLPLLLALAGCPSAETGIDDTRLTGVVRIEPVTRKEKNDTANNGEALAQVIDPLGYRITALSGTLSAFALDPDNDAPGEGADRDWYEIGSSLSFPAAFTLNVPDADEGTRIRVDVYDLDTRVGAGQTSQPTLLHSFDLAGETSLAVGFELAAGIRYGLVVSGLEGAPGLGYTVEMPGPHPDEAGVLVGAYLGADAATRGRPVGGSTPGAFALGEDLAYEASYEMFLIRSVDPGTDDDPEDDILPAPVVNEALERVYVFAGDWPNLNAALPAGTWYTGTPAEVALDAELIEVPKLVLDAVAPLVIGKEVADSEPNDVAISEETYTLDVSNPDAAQDAGVLTGEGFVDLFTGEMAFVDDAAGWHHDFDAFAFTVASPLWIGITLDWSDADDVDLIVFDAAGDPVDDYATATGAKPEVGAGFLVEPELVYYLVVAGYLGPAGGSAAYEVKVEQSAP